MPYESTLDASQITDWGTIFYIRGVGSYGSKLQETIAGAVGAGVIERIALAYHWFCNVYNPGDVVAVFGFSRGAFSARSFCGLLNAIGICKTENAQEAKRIVHAYLDGKTSGVPVPVEYLGIFDTVGTTIEKEKSHHLSPTNVKSARHALAIDEQRKSFRPHYWNRTQGKTKIIEAWFVGAHSNIGGSYPDKNLSNIALFWILKGAADAGISYPLPKALGWDDERAGVAIRDSWGDWFTRLPLSGIIARRLELHQIRRTIPAHHKFHASVYETLINLRDYKPVATFDDQSLTASLVSQRVTDWELP